jgi:hypothetical protein
MRYLYEITKEGDPNKYIGSTIDMWTRYTTHKRLCKTVDRKLYNYIRDNGDFASWDMDCVGFCETMEDEIELIKELQPTLNTLMYVGDKEYIAAYKKAYYKNNKEELLAYNKAHYEVNKEAILAKLNQKVPCECGGKYTHVHKARHCRSKLHQSYLLNQVQTPAG